MPLASVGVFFEDQPTLPKGQWNVDADFTIREAGRLALPTKPLGKAVMLVTSSVSSTPVGVRGLYIAAGPKRIALPLTSYAEFPTQLQVGLVHVIQRKEQASAMAASGQMRKTRLWFFTQHLITVEVPTCDRDYLNMVRAFYDAVDGDLTPFLFQDWTNRNPVGEFCGRGDGTRTLFKIRGDAFGTIAVYTVATPGAVRVLQTSGFTADPMTGLITFTTAPATGVVVQADVTDEKYSVFFQGFTTKHVHTGAWLPFSVTYKGGLAYSLSIGLVQQKNVV